MNRLLKFFYRFQNQRRIHKWDSFWTVVKMAWAQSGRKSNYNDLLDDNLMINEIPIGFTFYEWEHYKDIFYCNCNHKYEYSNGIRKCLKCGKENRYYLGYKYV